jgi:hypothetical protein
MREKAIPFYSCKSPLLQEIPIRFEPTLKVVIANLINILKAQIENEDAPEFKLSFSG